MTKNKQKAAFSFFFFFISIYCSENEKNHSIGLTENGSFYSQYIKPYVSYWQSENPSIDDTIFTSKTFFDFIEKHYGKEELSKYGKKNKITPEQKKSFFENELFFSDVYIPELKKKHPENVDAQVDEINNIHKKIMSARYEKNKEEYRNLVQPEKSSWQEIDIKNKQLKEHGEKLKDDPNLLEKEQKFQTALEKFKDIQNLENAKNLIITIKKLDKENKLNSKYDFILELIEEAEQENPAARNIFLKLARIISEIIQKNHPAVEKPYKNEEKYNNNNNNNNQNEKINELEKKIDEIVKKLHKENTLMQNPQVGEEIDSLKKKINSFEKEFKKLMLKYTAIGGGITAICLLFIYAIHKKNDNRED
jgi:hypothetical protein